MQKGELCGKTKIGFINREMWLMEPSLSQGKREEKIKIKCSFPFLHLTCSHSSFKLSSDIISLLKLSLTFPHRINFSFIDIPVAF